MANPDGIISGSRVLFYTMVSNTQTLVGGLTTNGSTYNTELIDVTNKSDPDYRYLLEGEGTQSVDHTADCLFSDDDAYQLLRTRWKAKTIDQYWIDYNGKSEVFLFQITNFSDNVANNEAVTTSLTLTSSDEFGQLQEELNFVVTDDGGSNFVVTDNGGSNFVVY